MPPVRLPKGPGPLREPVIVGGLERFSGTFDPTSGRLSACLPPHAPGNCRIALQIFALSRRPPRYLKGETRIVATLPPGVVRVSESQRLRYTRFERARIIGARALQISMGAPLLIDVPVGVVDPIDIADLEFRKLVIPITVKR